MKKIKWDSLPTDEKMLIVSLWIRYFIALPLTLYLIHLLTKNIYLTIPIGIVFLIVLYYHDRSM